MRLFDSHAHLESARFADDRQAVIARAHAAGVTRIMSCGTDLPTSQANVALARAHPGIWAAVGIHGHAASSAWRQGQAADAVDEDLFSQLAELARDPVVRAVGEIGLDYHYDLSPRPIQRRVLARQLALAQQVDLPVILHNRDADADTRALVDAAGDRVRGVLHCFLAGEAMAEWALARGLYLGVAGPITFRADSPLISIMRVAPHDRLLIETDCPYLAPRPYRGQRNEPALVVDVAQRLADVLGMPIGELASITTANATRLFGVS
jgi:TatD DNase family protein